MLDSGSGFWTQDLGSEFRIWVLSSGFWCRGAAPPHLVRIWGCPGGLGPLWAPWGEGGTAEPPQPPTPSPLVFQTPLLDSESSLDYGHSITQVRGQKFGESGVVSGQSTLGWSEHLGVAPPWVQPFLGWVMTIPGH